MMKKLSIMKQLALALGLTILTALPAIAHNSVVAISSPDEGQTFQADNAPFSVSIVGTVNHESPSNASGFEICVSEDGVNLSCELDCEGLGNASTCEFNVPVSLGFGTHALVITAAKAGSHTGSADVTIVVERSEVVCDEKDPPAIANAYLNSLELPQSFAKVRGKVIRQIANNHSDGIYGSCDYDETLVQQHVYDALVILGY